MGGVLPAVVASAGAMRINNAWSAAMLAVLFTVTASAAEETKDPPANSELKKLAMVPSGGKVPYWTLGESSFVDGSDVHLIGKDPKTKGTFWANEQCHADQWEVQFKVEVS